MGEEMDCIEEEIVENGDGLGPILQSKPSKRGLAGLKQPSSRISRRQLSKRGLVSQKQSSMRGVGVKKQSRRRVIGGQKEPSKRGLKAQQGSVRGKKLDPVRRAEIARKAEEEEANRQAEIALREELTRKALELREKNTTSGKNVVSQDQRVQERLAEARRRLEEEAALRRKEEEKRREEALAARQRLSEEQRTRE